MDAASYAEKVRKKSNRVRCVRRLECGVLEYLEMIEMAQFDDAESSRMTTVFLTRKQVSHVEHTGLHVKAM